MDLINQLITGGAPPCSLVNWIQIFDVEGRYLTVKRISYSNAPFLKHGIHWTWSTLHHWRFLTMGISTIVTAGMTILHGKIKHGTYILCPLPMGFRTALARLIRFVPHQVSSCFANHLPSPPSCGKQLPKCHNSELGGSSWSQMFKVENFRIIHVYPCFVCNEL